MKKLIIVLAVMLMSGAGCTTYKPFIAVAPATIPYGSTEIIASGSIDDVKSVLQKNTIMFRESEGGLETEEILIDEGTRAMYKVYAYENNLKIVPYWGITQKVKSAMTVWAGYGAASAYSTDDWERAVYEKGMNGKMSRPGMVFSYGYELAKQVDGNAKVK